MHAFLDELTSMRETCESLEQSDRGAARLRGFVSQDLFNLVKLTVGSFDDIVHFVSVANGFSLEKFRSTPPYSAVNETSTRDVACYFQKPSHQRSRSWHGPGTASQL